MSPDLRQVREKDLTPIGPTPHLRIRLEKAAKDVGIKETNMSQTSTSTSTTKIMNKSKIWT